MAPRVLTVQSLLDELGLELGRRRGGGARAPVRWVHISELQDPTPWLSGGELMLTTGIPLDTAEQAARLRRASSPSATSRGSASAPASATTAAQGAGRRGRRSGTSRSSRSPTRCRSSRSPRRPSPAGQRAVRGAAAGIAVQRRLERLVLEERGLEEIAATIASAVGGTVAILDGRGERLAGRGFRRQLSAEAVGGDPPRGARPRRRRRTPSSPRILRSPGARSPTRWSRRAAARRRPGW